MRRSGIGRGWSVRCREGGLRSSEEISTQKTPKWIQNTQKKTSRRINRHPRPRKAQKRKSGPKAAFQLRAQRQPQAATACTL
jgi:hypothetical protein